MKTKKISADKKNLNSSGKNKEKNVESINNVKKRIEELEKHLEKNKHDYPAKRAMTTLKARLHKLEKYMQKKNK